MDERHRETDSQPSSSPKRRTPWNTVEGRVISLVSRKGGVGKTTSAVNLGAAFALSGHSVLIVGTDPQCGVCRTLGAGPESLTAGLVEVFAGAGSMTDFAQPSSLENLFFISPNIISLQEEEMYLENMALRSDLFAAEIDRARNLYDTILIDCPPSLGAPTQAALLASDSYLVPVQAEELCRESIEPLLDYVESFRERYFPEEEKAAPAAAKVMPLNIEGMFLTMANERTRIGRHVAARVEEEFGHWLLENGIPRNTRLSEMALKGKPAVIYDRRSKGSRAYFDLADEILLRYLHTERDEHAGQDESRHAAESADQNALRPGRPEGQRELGNLGGLDRFLDDLAGGSGGPTVPRYEEPEKPDMVSLDDLLAEEEDQSHSSRRGLDDWSADWPSDDSDSDRRLN